MKKLKAITSTLVLTGVIMMGVSSAHAGMIMSDFGGGSDTNPCTSVKSDTDTKVDHGIIIAGLIGIFGEDVIKSIIGNTDGQTNCGIIITG